MKHGIIILFLLFSLSSCFKKEDPVILPAGNSEIASLSLGVNYEKEVFFDLGTNSYQERKWADWDIRFESSRDGYGVFINTGKEIEVRKIDIHSLIEPLAVDTTYFKTKPALIDAPEGKASMSAMGDWKSYKTSGTQVLDGIYVIERKNYSGIERYKRIQIQAVNDSFYYVRITNLYKDNKPVTWGETLEIRKNTDQNFTYYAFNNGGAVVDNAEPHKSSWDFVFTRYKHIFYNVLPNNQPFPYTLSGVLSNTNNVEVARDSVVTEFEKIDGSSVGKYTFTKNRNGIGYDWKTHAQGPVGAYSITPGVTYIIRDTDGYYYKLRFLDYNNSLGQPGYPKFEFIRIK